MYPLSKKSGKKLEVTLKQMYKQAFNIRQNTTLPKVCRATLQPNMEIIARSAWIKLEQKLRALNKEVPRVVRDFL